MAIGYCILPGKIGTKVITKVPYQANNNTLTYTGSNLTPTWGDYDSNQLTLSVTAQKNAGTYTATFTPKNNCIWADGTTIAKTVQWIINRAALSSNLSTFSAINVSYTGSSIGPTFDSGITSTCIITGNTAVKVGTYKAYITPDKNHCWSDKTYGPRTRVWNIIKRTIPKPTITSSLTYIPYTVQSPTFSIDQTFFTIYNNKGTNAGTYTAVCRLNDKFNTEWTDHTITDYSLTWSISKATPTFSFNYFSNNIIFSPQNSTQKLNYNYNGDGYINISFGDNTLCSYIVDTITRVITLTALKTGSTTMVVSFAAGSNYNASSSITVTLYVNKPENILTNRTYQDIKNIITAGNAANYFKVGDYMPIILNGYTTRYDSTTITDDPNETNKVSLVLNNYKVYAFILGINHNSSLEGNNKVHFCLGMLSDTEAEKNNIPEFTQIAFCDKHYGIFMNSKYNNSNSYSPFIYGRYTASAYKGWENSFLKLMMNGNHATFTGDISSVTIEQNALSFFDLFPSNLQSLVNYQPKYGIYRLYTDTVDVNTVSATSFSDYLWMLNVKEVLGYGGTDNECNVTVQYDYFKNGNNYIVYGHNKLLTRVDWWTRSPSNSSKGRMCCIRNNNNYYEKVDWYCNYDMAVRPCFTL